MNWNALETFPNIQHSNVGNVGDILKHAALVELGCLIKKRNLGQRVCYLDTHTYLYEAVMSRGDWSEHVRAREKQHPAYARYRDLEQDAVNKGCYLCSSALAHRVLENPLVYLAENDPATHDALAHQLATVGITCAAFKYDSREYRKMERACPQGPLFALVDPFQISDGEWVDLWMTVTCAVQSIREESSDGLILVFRYENEKVPDWPDAPPGFGGMVGVIAEKPYYLALYATQGIAGEAQTVLRGLGWNVEGNDGVIMSLR